MFKADYYIRPRCLPIVLSLTLLASASFRGFAAEMARTVKTSVAFDLLAQIEKELARLNAQAEKEPGPEWPRPSARVAYLLLAGLAAQGSLLDLPDRDRLSFGVATHGGVQGRIFEVTPDARVALVDRWIQDKSGSYVQRGAELFVRRAGKWVSTGKGTAIGKD